MAFLLSELWCLFRCQVKVNLFYQSLLLEGVVMDLGQLFIRLSLPNWLCKGSILKTMSDLTLICSENLDDRKRVAALIAINKEGKGHHGK